MNPLWLVSFVFAVVASLIAHGKGRNSLGWFTAGLFIGPFSMIVAFLSPTEKDGLYTQCGSCREVIRLQATKCRFCGTSQ